MVAKKIVDKINRLLCCGDKNLYSAACLYVEALIIKLLAKRFIKLSAKQTIAASSYE